MERFAPSHHGYPHTSDLIRVKALKGRMCHQITDVSVRPFLHLLNLTRRPRQESGHPVVSVSGPLSILFGGPHSGQLCRRRHDACFIVTSLHQDGQRDAR
jgi:hypothetical protein